MSVAGVKGEGLLKCGKRRVIDVLCRCKCWGQDVVCGCMSSGSECSVWVYEFGLRV